MRHNKLTMDINKAQTEVFLAQLKKIILEGRLKSIVITMSGDGDNELIKSAEQAKIAVLTNAMKHGA